MPAPPGADALGHRALGIEFELELAREVLPLELLVLAHVGGNHLADLAALQQQAEPRAVDAGVVRDHGQILDARIVQRGNQLSGMPHRPNPPHMSVMPSLTTPARRSRRPDIPWSRLRHRPLVLPHRARLPACAGAPAR